MYLNLDTVSRVLNNAVHRLFLGSMVLVIYLFYRKMGYEFRNEIKNADEYGVVRPEKRKEQYI